MRISVLDTTIGSIMASFVFAGAPDGWAQSYPAKLIRVVAPGAGGSSDFAARLIAQGITGPLGQPVIVDNQPTVSFIETAAKAPPDGYTLLIGGGVFTTGPLLQQAAPYDPVKDFAPVTLALREPNILVVHPSLPVKTLKELIALAKAKPGQLNYASSGVGGGAHLSGELFKSMAGVDIVNVQYKSGGVALNFLLGGEVQMTIDGSQLVPQIKSGKLRALAITTLQPSALYPTLPTLSASGLAGYESVGSQGVYAPAKTPDGIIRRLNQEIVRALNNADSKIKVSSIGMEVVGSSPEELGAKLQADIMKWTKVIKDAGIRPN